MNILGYLAGTGQEEGAFGLRKMVVDISVWVSISRDFISSGHGTQFSYVASSSAIAPLNDPSMPYHSRPQGPQGR